MKYNNLILINIQMMNCTHTAEEYGNNSINKLFCDNPLLIIVFFCSKIFYEFFQIVEKLVRKKILFRFSDH